MTMFPRFLWTNKPSASIRCEPHLSSMQDNQLLFGAGFEALSSGDGWVYGRSVEDAYEGYVQETDLVSLPLTMTHRLKAPRSLVFPEPDFKAPPLMVLSLNARLSVKHAENGFVYAEHAGWIFEKHVTEKAHYAPDYVEVAQSLLGAPYFWGGKDAWGYDCSGLVQMSLAAAGIAFPRDSGPQEVQPGQSVPVKADLSGLQPGDLVFWPGHVGMMANESQLVHANAYHMAVVSEPLKTVVERVTPLIGPISSVKRLQERKT